MLNVTDESLYTNYFARTEAGKRINTMTNDSLCIYAHINGT